MDMTPYCDQVISIQRERGLGHLYTFFKELQRRRNIDLIVDMHGTLRALFLRLFFPFIPRVVVDKRTIERSLLTFFKWDLLSMQNSSTLKRDKRRGEPLLLRNILDFKLIFDLPKIELNKPLSFCTVTFSEIDWDSFKLKWQLQGVLKKEFITVVPTASFPEKRWSKENFYQMIELSLNHQQLRSFPILLLAGKNDEFCREFDSLEKKYPNRFFNLQGKTSLIESAQLLKNALVCVGNDTGLPHIAESVGTKALFILGPTGEEFGFYPHLKESDFIGLKLWCRPCTTNGKGNCIRSERFCLTQITPNMVINKLIKLVDGHAF
ncbi:MAG: glycosyltransferase family 9 protein [Bacteriovoracaceae bacterium]